MSATEIILKSSEDKVDDITTAHICLESSTWATETTNKYFLYHVANVLGRISHLLSGNFKHLGSIETDKAIKALRCNHSMTSMSSLTFKEPFSTINRGYIQTISSLKLNAMDRKKEAGKDKSTERRVSRRIAALARAESIRKRRADAGGYEVGDTSANPVVLSPEEVPEEIQAPVVEPTERSKEDYDSDYVAYLEELAAEEDPAMLEARIVGYVKEVTRSKKKKN